MATRTKKKAFWDTYQDEGGGKYLTAPEKAALIDKGTVLEIVGVKYDEKNQFQGNPQPRYVVTFNVPAKVAGVKEGERFAGFAISEDGDSSRDRLLEALTEYIGSKDAEPVFVQMEKIGQFVAITKADV
jgi:hypothetical protein